MLCLPPSVKPFHRPSNLLTHKFTLTLNDLKFFLCQWLVHRCLTLHVELVGDPEIVLQRWVADHTGKCMALDVTCGLPEVAHLCAGRAVDFIK